MTITLPRMTRVSSETITFPISEATATGAKVAILPKRRGPNAATVWTTVAAFDVPTLTATVRLVGPDADPTGATLILGEADGDLWALPVGTADVEPEKIGRLYLLGGTGVGNVAPGIPYEPRINRTGATTGQVPVLQADSTLAFGTVAGGGGGSDATTSAKGIVQLAGDLAGTAAAPTVPGLAGKLTAASSLSDVASATTARTNLGLGTAAVVNTGTASGNVPLLSTGGLLPIARIASGTPDGTKYVRDDGTLASPAGGFTPPTGASLVLATDSTTLADAYPQYTWLILADATAPAVPTGLSATPGDTQVVLDWADNTEPDFSHYERRHGTANPPTGTPTSVTPSTATVTGLTDGTLYYFQVRALDATGNASAWSSAVSATPVDTTPPATPTGLAATPGNTQLVLDWADNTEPDLNRYEYRTGTASPPTGTPVSTGTTSAATVTGLTNGTLYYVQVRAVDAVGNASSWSTAVSATPTAGTTVPGTPTGVTGTPGNTQVALSWTAPASDGGSALTDYVIQYSSNSGSTWTTFSEGTSTVTSTTVTGLTNGTAYVFHVAAVNAVGQGAYSSASSPVTPAGTVLTDAFTGTAAAALTGRTGVAAGGANFVISPSGTTAQRATTSAGALCCVYGPLSTSDNKAIVTVPTRGAATNVGPICRSNTAMDTFYSVRLNNNVIELVKSVTGTITVLAGTLGTYVAGDILEVRAIGSTISCYRNSTLLTSLTDTSVTTGIYGGIRAGGNATQATMDDLTVADT